jgi:hypothetical protein
MVLQSKLTYEPPIEEIKSEGDVIVLLDDVAANLHSVGYPTPMVSLREFLPIIKKGKYKIQGKDKFSITSVDLSKARDLIADYRRKSEGGCQSCNHIGKHMPFPDEHVTYCGLYEAEDVVSEGSSPRINKYYNKGCNERAPIFSKTIETILKKH